MMIGSGHYVRVLVNRINLHNGADCILMNLVQLINLGLLASLLALIVACATPTSDSQESESPSQKISQEDDALTALVDKLSAIPLANKGTRPIDRYMEILSSAKSGDADAQYELAQLYNFCIRIPDEAEQKALIARGMPANSMKYFGKARELCEGFELAYEGWADPKDAVEYWSSQALAQAHPLSVAEESLKKYRDWTRLKVRYEQAGETLQPPKPYPSDEQIYLALERGAEHPELIGYALQLAYRYFRVFRAEAYMASQGYDPKAGKTHRGPLREAWSILGCYHLPSCSIETHLTDMRKYYSDNEMDEIVQTAIEVYEAALSHDWEPLGLAD